MDNEAHRILTLVEALRSRARELQRLRRQTITAEQREAQNARRRHNYRTRRSRIQAEQSNQDQTGILVNYYMVSILPPLNN